MRSIVCRVAGATEKDNAGHTGLRSTSTRGRGGGGELRLAHLDTATEAHLSEREMSTGQCAVGAVPPRPLMWVRAFRISGSRNPERPPTLLPLKRATGVYPVPPSRITGRNHPSPLSCKMLLQSVIICFRVESQ